ncbi:MAG: hypothetical protein IPJ58_18640 [Ardenticatenia bacterium]|nr:hypothetical protein [Ardenticatenia bacterium]
MIPRKPRANRVALLSLLSFLMATVAVGAGPSGRGPVLGQKLSSASDTSLLVEGQWGGAYQAVALSPDGGLAYVGSGAGLWILRIAGGSMDGAEVLGVSAPLPGPIRDLALDGDVLYAAGQTGGVWAMDVADPANPTLLGIEPGIPAIVNMVADSKHRVHLSRGNATMTSMDFSDPRSPQALGCAVFEDGAGVWDIAVNGSMGYLAMNEHGLRALDLTDPMAPVIRSALPAIDGQPLFVTAVAQYGGLVLGADGPRLRIIDWRDPDGPRHQATLQLPDEDIKAISILGRTAFVAAQAFVDSRLILHRVDLTDPLNPAWVQAIDLGILEDGLGAPDGYALALSQLDRRLAVATGSQGFKVIDWIPPVGAGNGTWAESAGLAKAPWARSVNQSYLAAGRSGVWITAGRSPGPRLGLLELAFDSAGEAESFVFAGFGYDAFLADGSGGVRWYHQMEGERVWPRFAERAALRTLSAAKRIAVLEAPDGRPLGVYVADLLGGLRVVQPPPLQDLGPLDLGFDLPEDVAVDAGTRRLYVAHGSAVSVFGLADPLRPTRLATIDTPGFASGVAVGPGGRLGVADGEAGLTWYDVTDPTRPLLRGSVDTDGTAVRVAFDVEGSRAFVADREGGLQVVDLSVDPATILATFTLPFPVVDVSMASIGSTETVRIAAQAGGVYQLRLGEAPPPATVTPTPRRTAMAHETPIGHGTPTGTVGDRIWLPRLFGGTDMAPVHP